MNAPPRPLQSEGPSPDAAGALAVSVVVAVRNGAHQLPGLLEALSRQTLPREQFEVLVVDDGSTDDTERVARESGLARVIRCGQPVGKPRAVNMGIRAAAAEVIALTDADTVPDGDWLELGLRRMRDEEVDILGGGITVTLGDRPSVAALVDAMNWLDQRRCCEQQRFPVGANTWARRATFERHGLFDEEIPYYHNDAEWGKRATGAGAVLVYAPEVHVSHPPRTELRQVAEKAYRLGAGLAPHRRPPFTTIGGLPPLFLSPRAYLPPRRINLGRLAELGQPLSRASKVRIYLAQWLFVMLPMLVGDLSGELDYARRRERRPRSTPVRPAER